MADVQIENGYTKIANQILENIVRLPMNGTQLKIIMVIWRNTYGFSRKEAELSESYISKATGIDRRNVRREIAGLIINNIVVVVKEAGFTSPRIIKFNKNYDEWERANLPPEGKYNPEGEEATTPGGEFTPQQRKNLKKELKKYIYTDDFEKFYSVYPRAEEKQRTFKNWNTYLKNFTVEELIQAGINYRNKVTQAGTERQFIKTSANFLGREGFFKDYIEYKTPAVNDYADVKR